MLRTSGAAYRKEYRGASACRLEARKQFLGQRPLRPEAKLARILVIDDDPALCEVARAMLEKAGHAVATAGNGRIGLATVAREPIDVVLTDIVMPEMDG